MSSFKNTESLCVKIKSINRILECLNDNPPDYIHVSTFDRLESVQLFLNQLTKSKTSVVVEVDIDEKGKFSISYQLLEEFYSDCMLLRGPKNKFLMFMSPF